jgi:hypothetical protein
MKRLAIILLVALCAKAENACQDSIYLQICQKPISAMSQNEFQYWKEYKLKCEEANKSSRDSSGKNALSMGILISLMATAAIVIVFVIGPKQW